MLLQIEVIVSGSNSTFPMLNMFPSSVTTYSWITILRNLTHQDFQIHPSFKRNCFSVVSEIENLVTR
jgi:hypothetical protein